MEWKKAKNYTIIFLAVINCLLFGFNFVKHGETRIGAREAETLSVVLQRKGITLNCDLPADFSDMGQLYMRAYEYDNIVLQEIFFDTISGVRRTEQDGDIIFSRNDDRFTVSRGSVSFEKKLDHNINDSNTALAAVEDYVRELNNSFTDYRQRVSGETEDGYFFEFRQNYQNQPVFSNYLNVWAGRDGSLKIVFNYQQPLEYKGSKGKIISAQEAVYAASKVISEDFRVTTVDRVEKGYYLSERQGSGELAAVPQYKVYVDGCASAYYVNAYSGDVVRV